jgi:acyl homoserine lactone synthase
MFKDRASQFSERLKWDVTVDERGYERDQYDALNPIYVIIENDEGQHAGSLRLLPTTGRTMINEYFSSALEGDPINSSTTWECTRFCLSPSANPRTAPMLFASAGRLLQEFQITTLVAVFDKFMLRKYRISGVMPEVLGEGRSAGSPVLAGRWQFSQRQLNDQMRRGSLDPHECEIALVNSSLFEQQELISA